MKTTRREGFTLIELLVVIAIIAILAAILFPVFARAREKARQASCQSNEKQLALALHMYFQDYDEVFPTSWFYSYTGLPNRGTWFSWPWKRLQGWGWGGLEPYVKNDQLTVCPSRSNLVSGYVTDRCRFKWRVIDPGRGDGCERRLAEVRRPAEVVLFFETDAQNNACCLNWIPYPHNDGQNLAYVDGHVKWVTSAGGTYGQPDRGANFRAKYLIDPAS